MKIDKMKFKQYTKDMRLVDLYNSDLGEVLDQKTISKLWNNKECNVSSITEMSLFLGIPIEKIVDWSSIINMGELDVLTDDKFHTVKELSSLYNLDIRSIEGYIKDMRNFKLRYGFSFDKVGNVYMADSVAVLDYIIYRSCINDQERYDTILPSYSKERLLDELIYDTEHKEYDMLEKYDDILTVNDLKEILHYKSNTTIYKMLNNGDIEAVHKGGNKWLIPKQNVVKYLMDLK